VIIGSILILVSSYLILDKLARYEDYGDKLTAKYHKRVAALQKAEQAKQAQEAAEAEEITV